MTEFGWTPHSLKAILCGGEAFPRELAASLLQHRVPVWNLYGPTETTIWSMVGQVRSADAHIPLGGPIGDTQIYVLDACCQPVPIGTVGEIYIEGLGVSHGYYNDPEQTAERFVVDPFSEIQGRRLYKTCDLARLNEQSENEFVGRTDFQVKIRGHRIELGEIETCLSRHPGVSQVVVAAQNQNNKDTILAAYFIPEETSVVDIASLRQFLEAALPFYMVPSIFIQMKAFELTPSVGDFSVEILLILRPCHSINAWGRFLLDIEEGIP